MLAAMMSAASSAHIGEDPKQLPAQLNARVRASLVLADGAVFQGFSFGYQEPTSGEVVFNTGMVGYPESLTDPSYCGQILVLTFPLVGNYGVASEERDVLGLLKHFESEKIHLKAVVIQDYSFVASHHTAEKTLGDWLKEQRVPGIYGVDTRAVTKLIRQHGSVLGKIEIDGSQGDSLDFDDPGLVNLPAQVSRKDKQVFLPPAGPDECPEADADRAEALRAAGMDANVSSRTASGEVVHILAVDCGIKNNIIRYLVNVLRVKLTLVPWNYDFTNDEFDGLFLSNGPGDPVHCQVTIEHIRTVMQRPNPPPIFGICMGNQLLALAAGAKTYKMKFGNRGMNQPCVDLRTNRCYVTPQNHGYAVDANSLPADWTPLMVNANDGSNEGVIHRAKPWFSVQFHPEARGGPTDTAFLFHTFVRNITEPRTTAVTTIPYSLPVHRRKVLVLGSGGLTIGQAGEFDYSGSQAIKALRESGVRSVLMNPNIATVQTSSGYADRVYFLPVNPEFVTKVIKRERPDGILCTFGGQTALNCAVRLEEMGIFEKYHVQVMGTPIKAIVTTEDRELFAQAVDFCGYKVAESACCSSVDEAVAAARDIGYPVLIRAAFALGGLGSGFANDDGELRALVNQAFVNSPQVIVDKSLKGWKELEYEVVRDASNNCITVCNMENLDPMGIHTGESIVIAPSQTLSNEEYFRLRECALRVVRHLGVVGECNIQYAVDPCSKEFRIIEVNARLSRSSALASKATGYPLAYVAAKIALGNDLVSLRNSVTKVTTACFEPSLDYCVAKVPRWDLRKFTSVDPAIGSCMKSVGEVMAIGRSFEEVIQKALRMVDESCCGFEPARFDSELHHRGVPLSNAKAAVIEELQMPTPARIWSVAKAYELGMSVEAVHELTGIDGWFLSKLHHIHRLRTSMRSMDISGLASNAALLAEAKRCGFADRQIANDLCADLGSSQVSEKEVRQLRKDFGITPVVKQIDTLAAEFPAETNYLYLTYSGIEHDVSLDGIHPVASRDSDISSVGDLPKTVASGTVHSGESAKSQKTGSKVVVLGCGPHRIGSSVEFDWCSVSCIKTLRSLGHEAIVINCNPETVSTDFDESDRLYFEELSHETVLDIAELENPGGVVVSVGGQTPNNLAMGLHENGVRILGTSVEAIDACENRFKFSQLCDSMHIDQPEWSEFTTVEEAFQFTERAGFPVLVRPSYVLSGAAMRVVCSSLELEGFLLTAAVVSRDYPVVISKYISGAKEVELDAIGQAGTLVNYAIAEHVENAGIHSGDASLLLPAQKLFVETHRRVKAIGAKICKALNISGPFNVQFMCKDNEVMVIECNLRASRSLPFISKTYNVNFIDIATRVMLGIPQEPVTIQPMDMDCVAAKVPVFSFSRLKNSDPRLGVEMQSTGEVACFGQNQYEAFLKAMISGGFKLPTKNILVSIGPAKQKAEFVQYASMLSQMGYQLFATKATAAALKSDPNTTSSVIVVNKPLINREPNALTMVKAGRIDLVINVPGDMDSQALSDGFHLRRAAVDSGVSLVVDIKTAILLTLSLHRKFTREQSGKEFFSLKSWQEYCEVRDIRLLDGER